MIYRTYSQPRIIIMDYVNKTEDTQVCFHHKKRFLSFFLKDFAGWESVHIIVPVKPNHAKTFQTAYTELTSEGPKGALDPNQHTANINKAVPV